MGVTGTNSICAAKTTINLLSAVVGGCLMKHKPNSNTDSETHQAMGYRQCLSIAYYPGFTFSPNESELLPREFLRYLKLFLPGDSSSVSASRTHS